MGVQLCSPKVGLCLGHQQSLQHTWKQPFQELWEPEGQFRKELMKNLFWLVPRQASSALNLASRKPKWSWGKNGRSLSLELIKFPSSCSIEENCRGPYCMDRSCSLPFPEPILIKKVPPPASRDRRQSLADKYSL